MGCGAGASVIPGGNIHAGVKEGLHAGISEFYVGKGARLTFTMVHNWDKDFSVRPRTAAIVDDDGVFISNYVLLRPVRSIQAFPVARLEGARSRAVFNTIEATMRTAGLLTQSQQLTVELQSGQSEPQQTKEGLGMKAKLLAEQKA